MIFIRLWIIGILAFWLSICIIATEYRDYIKNNTWDEKEKQAAIILFCLSLVPGINFAIALKFIFSEKLRKELDEQYGIKREEKEDK